jgi:hypothetical protein
MGRQLQFLPASCTEFTRHILNASVALSGEEYQSKCKGSRKLIPLCRRLLFEHFRPIPTKLRKHRWNERHDYG